MNIIAEGRQVIDILSNNEDLISGKLQKISIFYQDSKLIIELTVELLYSKQFRQVLIQFNGVSEYSFYYSLSHNFYYIEDYVFFKDDDMVYISLDPANPSEIKRNVDDNDFIVAEDVLLFSPTISVIQE
jgi:hypothetical protein